MHYFFYSISIIFLSMAVGAALNDVLKEKRWYTRFSNLHFIKSDTINALMGLGVYKWILGNTFLSRFNPKLKLNKTSSDEELKRLRQEMTYAELSHLIAFALVGIIGMCLMYFTNKVFGIILLGLNVLMNLYPSLLQQKNKSRIDRLL